MSNCLDPDQDRRSVGPDLGSNFLQVLSAADKVPVKLASKELNINQEEQQGRGLKKDKQSVLHGISLAQR